MREWEVTSRDRQKRRQARLEAATSRGISLGGSGGRQRVGEGSERLWRLIVADEFARQAGTRTEIAVEDVQAGRGRAAGRSRR
jgi:hypothetical protein